MKDAVQPWDENEKDIESRIRAKIVFLLDNAALTGAERATLMELLMSYSAVSQSLRELAEQADQNEQIEGL